MFCQKCGTEVPDDVKFCPKCGHDLSNRTKTNQTVNSSAPTSSISDRWNSFSTGKKIIVAIVVCCIGLYILGAIGSIVSPDANTSGNSADDAEAEQITEDLKVKDSNGNDFENPYDSSSSTGSSSSSSSLDSNYGVGDSSLQVKVIYSGSWDGAVGTIDSSNSVSGSGTKVLNIDGSSWDICSAVIQKKDSGSGKLTVQIIKDGNVKKESSTTASYGVVSVSD